MVAGWRSLVSFNSYSGSLFLLTLFLQHPRRVGLARRRRRDLNRLSDEIKLNLFPAALALSAASQAPSSTLSTHQQQARCQQSSARRTPPSSALQA